MLGSGAQSEIVKQLVKTERRRSATGSGAATGAIVGRIRSRKFRICHLDTKHASWKDNVTPENGIGRGMVPM